MVSPLHMCKQFQVFIYVQVHIIPQAYQDCVCTLAHSALRNCFTCRVSGTCTIFSVLHCLDDKGSCNFLVAPGGYVRTTSPSMEGSAALGKANGYVGFCHRNVGWILRKFCKFQKVLLRVHPAASRGKNSRCPRVFVPPGPPAWTKSPLIRSMFFAANVW